MSEKEKDPKEIGDDIERIREFGEKKDLPEETINSMIASEFKEEKSSVEEWLTQTVAGNGEQTSLEQIVSQEGFMEAAGDVLRNMIKGKKPDFNNMGSETTHDNIKRTYANLPWVKSRRLVTGEVSVPTGSILQGDFKADINKLLAAVKATCQANVGIVNKLLQDANPHIQLLTTDAWKDPKKVQVVDEKAKPLPEGCDFKNIAFKDLQANPAKLPALNAEQVVEVANLILTIRSVYYGGANPFKGSKWDDIFNVKVGGVGGMSRYEQAFSNKDPRYKVMEKHYEDDNDTWATLAGICEAFCVMGYGCEYDWSTNSEHGGWEMSLYLKALVGWIDGSVK